MNGMHALFIDFQNSRRRPGSIGMLILLIGLSVTTYVSIQMYGTFRTLYAQEANFSDILRRAKHIRHDAPISAAESQKMRAEIKDANAVMLQLPLPWNDLFREIAASQQKQIALLSIVPDANRRNIKISGEAKNLKVLLAYIRELQKSKSLNSVYLRKHRVNVRSAQKPVDFTIIANWVLSQ